MLDRYIRSVKTDTGHKVKVLWTDRRNYNQYVQDILKRYGIRQQTTVGYAPEQNGSAKWDLRTIVDGARMLRCAKNMH